MNIAADGRGEAVREDVAADDAGQVVIELVDIRHAAAEDDDVGVEDVDDGGEAAAEAEA